MVVEGEEEFFVAHDLLLPLGAVYLLEHIEGGARKVETVPVDVFEVRSPADRRLLAEGAATDTVDDPLEDAHVFAVAGPEEFAVIALAEPVDVEDARGGGEVALHAEPVTEVVAHVIAAEGEHGHGVATYFAGDAGRGRSGLGAHGGADVDAGGPVEGLIDEGHGGGATAAEDEGGDGDAGGVLPVGIDGGALAGGCGETAVGMRCSGSCGLADLGRPRIAAPVGEIGRGGVGHALPPDAALWGEGYVGEDGVFGKGRGGVGLDPGDVVADGPDLPAVKAGGRNHHGEVRLAAGAWEGGGDVGFFVRGRLDAEDQHVLGHPAFVASDVGGDAEGETLFA